MAEILLLNPRKRRRKMSALQRKYFGKRAKNPRKKRRRSLAVARASATRRRRARGGNYGNFRGAIGPSRLTNPRRRKRRILTAAYRTIRRRRRSNPSLRLGSIPNRALSLLKSGGIGASGAIAADLLWGYGKGYLPDFVAGSAIAQYATKLLVAIGVGLLGEKVWRGKGREMAVGAATVTLHDALKAQLQASFPDVKLGEYLTFAPTVGTMEQAGRLLSTGMSGVGEYLSGLPQAVGYETDNSGYYGSGNGDFTGDGLSGY